MLQCSADSFVGMEGLHTIKQKRVYSLEPNALLRANFSHTYIHYLLPALIKISKERTGGDKNEAEEIKKIVRLEVDMALVLSASGFAWSHALKHKLEGDVQAMSLLNTSTLPSTSLSLLFAYKHDRLKRDYRRPIKKRTRIRGDEKEIGHRLMTLRRILPGGDEMTTSELFSEVKSYVLCLELQVSILGTLVHIH
ncbi:hypothetical protein MRB53_008856 [Persea americana]|uniref:Uncharacterized protein n=1 Tax=Persea americana TaxID=3435 RepID=A0ACC2LNG6_PERAE|nr:hypothetical protein MRB53_008856 [Persea americana]